MKKSKTLIGYNLIFLWKEQMKNLTKQLLILEKKKEKTLLKPINISKFEKLIIENYEKNNKEVFIIDIKFYYVNKLNIG